MKVVIFIFCAIFSYNVKCVLLENIKGNSSVLNNKNSLPKDQDIDGFYKYMDEDGSWEITENDHEYNLVSNYENYDDENSEKDKSERKYIEKSDETSSLDLTSHPFVDSKEEPNSTLPHQPLIFDKRRMDVEDDDEALLGIQPNLIKSLLG